MAAPRMIKAGEVRRAQVILRLVAGQSYRTIMKQEGCGQDFVARSKERFQSGALGEALCPASWQNCLRERHPPRSQDSWRY
jgi:transposase